MKIYNTLTQKKESFPPSHKGKLRLFVCGPTVYDKAHIGHARTYIFFDFFTKYLIAQNKKIYYIQNITDVDDRIIQRAKELNENPLHLSERYRKEYLKEMKKIGVTAVNLYARATDHIAEIISQIQTLLKKEFAYTIDGDGIYFDVSKFKNYGTLSHRTTAQAEDAISRIDENIQKRNKADFVLWKFPSKKLDTRIQKKKIIVIGGEPLWNTVLGWGRPGWHIEDTAISEKYFGSQYEMHGGGLDLKFPHHEAEITQQEAASGKTPFVQLWMHVGLLNVNGQKMSKSLHNFISIDDFLKKYSATLLRFIFARSHYRSTIDYTEKLLTESQTALHSLTEFVAKLTLLKSGIATNKIKNTLSHATRTFDEALQNDFNTPEALAVIFNLIHSLNHTLWDISKSDGIYIKKWLTGKLALFGITLPQQAIPVTIKSLLKTRKLCRDNKQFVQADTLRKEIETLGYVVEDTPCGQLILKKDLFTNS